MPAKRPNSRRNLDVARNLHEAVRLSQDASMASLYCGRCGMGNRLRRPVAKRRPDFRSRRRYRLGEFPHRQDRCRPIAQLVCWSNEVFAERDNENTLNRTKAYGQTAALMPVRPRATTVRASATCPNTPKCARMFSLIFASRLVRCRIL